ncbi:MAG: hypothetical protein ACLTTQ_01465 [Christensenellales bacterium]
MPTEKPHSPQLSSASAGCGEERGEQVRGGAEGSAADHQREYASFHVDT